MGAFRMDVISIALRHKSCTRSLGLIATLIDLALALRCLINSLLVLESEAETGYGSFDIATPMQTWLG